MPHSSQMILFVSSTWSSSSHPNNIMYEGIPAIATRSKALTQHISSSNGTKKGDNLAPLENYMDNTWGPLGETLRPLREGWPHQNGWIFGRVPNDLQPPLHRAFSNNYVANLFKFHAQKELFKGPKYATQMFGLEMIPPAPPLELFQKIICFVRGTTPIP